MKRMDEVFTLPIETDMLVRDIAYGLLDTADESAIAHAINHVDELADALDALLKELDLTFIGSANLSDCIHDADAALAAYRGNK